MNDYEIRRAARIKANEALFADLDIEPIIKPPRTTARPSGDQTPQTLPTASSTLPYIDDSDPGAVSRRRDTEESEDEAAQSSGSTSKAKDQARHPPALIPVEDIEALRKRWTDWTPTAPPPTRDEDGTLHFPDFPDFQPNKSPEEMLREGCFAPRYPHADDWVADLPAAWTAGLDVARALTSATYDPAVNKFAVACGQSIEAWEAAGWIAHAYDVRGWFQWYVRFFRGRRCADDGRQVGRWKRCVGVSGRWRRMLLRRYWEAGVREVFDDGEGEEGEGEVSPVVHQTCLQWGWEVRQGVLDAFWAEMGG
ncbi:vegetatible incompatibility protein HET-E-1 [Teratosphaeria destructans]|uniref:Vegetatible incompatibility protein HET-E-1 n=1 Tax=Teratosphaeria destructans TaxID=418781 RepID=A0A9W7SNQ4_9PEZI|nr:vegetatible incompatibility protein HET-E-1 [Teratosphaeria destructans]